VDYLGDRHCRCGDNCPRDHRICAAPEREGQLVLNICILVSANLCDDSEKMNWNAGELLTILTSMHCRKRISDAHHTLYLTNNLGICLHTSFRAFFTIQLFYIPSSTAASTGCAFPLLQPLPQYPPPLTLSDADRRYMQRAPTAPEGTSHICFGLASTSSNFLLPTAYF
jgi:hypothetical protein